MECAIEDAENCDGEATLSRVIDFENALIELIEPNNVISRINKNEGSK